MNFLSQLAEKIIDDNRIEYQDIAIILPNKRAQKKFYGELASKIAHPIFPPVVFSVDEFIRSISPIRLLSTSELLIELYEVYGKFEIAKRQSFQDFLSWGKVFLQDISEIDLHLASAQDIFSNLSDIKELESFGKEQLSQKQMEYLAFYKQLFEIYTGFSESLHAKNIGYSGLIYKDTAQNMEQYIAKLRYKKYYFAGLNALSPSEIQIVSYLHQKGMAEFYFDLDSFYFRHEANSPLHEFVDTLKQKLHLEEIHFVENHYAKTPKNVEIYGLTKQMGQLYLAAQILNGLSQQELDDTAVVFADESLIVPFIHVYDCANSNITMSYPLRVTHAFQLLQDLVTSAKNSRRFKENEIQYYYKDVLAFAQNPVIQQSFFPDKPAHNQFIASIIKMNHVFFNPTDLKKLFPNFPDLSKDGIALLTEICCFFTQIVEKIPDGFDKSILMLLIDSLNDTISILHSFSSQDLLDIPTLEYFLNEQMSDLAVPFQGDPNNGLQIMGLLETRTLDFKNILMISVNEGIIPVGKSDNSMLLYDIKCHYHLPTYQQKDYVYAYHFFRLLQRAEHVWLLYNTDSSDSLAEKSRFISQLEFEVKKQKLENVIRISRRNLTMVPKQSQAANRIEIPKTKEVMDKLSQYAFSPTSISTYINCPLQFYLMNVAKIEEQLTVNENIEKNIIGSVVHGILEMLLLKIKGNPSGYQYEIDNLRNNIDSEISSTFNKYDEVKGQDLTRGKLFLATEVVKSNLLTYLKVIEQDLRDNKFSIIGTEVRLSHKVKVGNHEVRLKGSCDRIDNRQGTITILDYKTGKVDEKKLKYIDMDTLFSDESQKQLLQLLMYSYLYRYDEGQQNSPHPDAVCCGIIGFQQLMKNSGNGMILPELDSGNSNLITNDLLDEFEDHLETFLEQIFDDNVGFKQTDNIDHCKYCDYKIVCGKVVE